MADNAVVEFSIETGVGNKLNCVLDGIGRWNGTNGVHVAPSGVVTNATAIVHLKCCMDSNHPQYGPNVVAFVNGREATRSPVVNGIGGHITSVDMLTGPNWGTMLNVANCDTFSKIMAHEVGHVFGIGHTTNGSGHLMQGNITINLQNGSSQGWNGYPNDCEKQRAAEALTAETGLGGNPSKPDWACEDEGFPGVADNKNCCNRLTAYTWTPSNIKPTGHITTLNGTVIPIGGSGTFTIHADDLDGEVTRVGWYVGGNLVYTAFSAPWSFPYSNAPAGQYTLSAAIYDTADVYVWSTNTVTVSVGGYFATDTLQTGEHLFPGYVLVAPNQAYYAQLGSDGRFNLYTSTSALVASTWTYGPPLYVRMNEDGNAVVRHQPFVDVFQTGTGSQTNAESGLRVLNSGSLAIVRRNGTIVWQYP